MDDVISEMTGIIYPCNDNDKNKNLSLHMKKNAIYMNYSMKMVSKKNRYKPTICNHLHIVIKEDRYNAIAKSNDELHALPNDNLLCTIRDIPSDLFRFMARTWTMMDIIMFTMTCRFYNKYKVFIKNSSHVLSLLKKHNVRITMATKIIFY